MATKKKNKDERPWNDYKVAYDFVLVGGTYRLMDADTAAFIKQHEAIHEMMRFIYRYNV